MRATEGFLARVGPDVTLEQPRSGEGLTTQHAFTRQRVGPNVHFEGTQTNVDFIAVFTAEGFFGLLLDAVQFLVFGQPAVGRVGFVAIGALVTRCGYARGSAALLGFGDADDGRIR